MPCDTKLKLKQTVQQRVQEVREAVARLDAALVAGRVKAVVGPQGAIAFAGWTDADRDDVTDTCAFRRLMVTGSTLAKLAIAHAEQMAGRSIDQRVVAHGAHSHDGGRTWHDHKG